MDYDWNFGVLWEYCGMLWRGILTTVGIVGLAVAPGILIGMLLTSLWMSENAVLRRPATAVIEAFRSAPPLVPVAWSYHCLSILTGLTLPGCWTCVVTISLCSGGCFAEIFRSGVQAVDQGLIEAAHPVGMSRLLILKRIIVPLAFLRIMPPFTGQCIMAIRNSSSAATSR